MRKQLLCALACGCFLVGCSGTREDRLGIGRNSAETGDASVEPSVTPPAPEPEPARAAQLGVSGGLARSPHYHARVMVSFPQGAGTSRGPHYAARLMRGAQ